MLSVKLLKNKCSDNDIPQISDTSIYSCAEIVIGKICILGYILEITLENGISNMYFLSFLAGRNIVEEIGPD